MTYTSEVLADSPLVALHLDETSGTTAADYSGNGRDMTSANCTLNQPGVMLAAGTSYDLNGSSSQISLADAAWQRPAAFTIKGWIKPDQVDFRAIAAKDAAGAGWAFYIVSGKLSLYTNGSAHTDTTTALSTGVKYMVSATYDSGTIKLYVNDTLVATFPGASLTQTSATSLLLGVSTGSNGGASRFFWFDGLLDEVEYYDTALSGARIAAHYAAGVATPITVSGTAWASGATFLDGAMPISIQGAPFTAPATMLDGSAKTAIRVSGDSFGAPFSALDGAVQGAPIPGATFHSALVMLDGGVIVRSGTDTSNVYHGRRRRGLATVQLDVPVTSPPAATATVRVDKAVALPAPVLMKGRPT